MLVKPAHTLSIIFEGLVRNAEFGSPHVIAEEIEALVDSFDEGLLGVLAEWDRMLLVSTRELGSE